MPFLKAWEVVRRKRKSVIANSFEEEEESEKKLIHLSVIIVKEGILSSA